MSRESDAARRLSEDQVRSILTRAAEIDNAGPVGLTIGELRTVALEAGISDAAFAAALAEAERSTSSPSAPTGPREKVTSTIRRMFSWFAPDRSVFGLLAVGVILGAVAAIFSTPRSPEIDYGAIVGFAGLVGITLARAVRSRSAAEYVREAAIMWSTFAAAWAGFASLQIGAEHTIEGLGILALYATLAIVVGSGINALVPSQTSTSGDDSALSGV